MSQQPPGPEDPPKTQPVAPETAPAAPGPYTPPPPPPTERKRLPRDRRPPPSLWALLGLLVAAGILIGFLFGHFVGRPSRAAADPNLLLFEPAPPTIPFPGAAFTASTYDPQRGMCDKAKLKQFLR